ncbi:hypothetical protein PIB30_041863 [Stylosanthes scabra]|uniref:Uncharacterized protein n=1 Tax=Stylosanthes scabra TaxID=79078 RepID=A0ABU6UFJ6_9FABA|nr:hypothetical protein [Stylosanthes scabra]
MPAQYPEQLPRTHVGRDIGSGELCESSRRYPLFIEFPAASTFRFLEASHNRRVRLDLIADIIRPFNCERGERVHESRTSCCNYEDLPSLENGRIAPFPIVDKRERERFFLFCPSFVPSFLSLNLSGSSRKRFLGFLVPTSSRKLTFLFRLEMAHNPQGEQVAAAIQEVPAAQMPHELPSIYRWVTPDVLGAPSILSQEYLDELKSSDVLFGGGDLERRYRVVAASPNKHVYFLNLNHPRVPNWLWVNEVMFTEFGIQISFTDFQQRLLNRSSIAPSQLHPNAWSAIRCFELVTEFLQLPQDPEIFLFIFSFFSSNTEGKTKKGYMSARPAKGKKIFGLYEDSFHDFKGRYFKIFPVGEHRPFWLNLEGQGRFPSYWSFNASLEYVPVRYKRLNANQRDVADILVRLFSERNLKPKSVIDIPSEGRNAIVRMAGQDVTLARLRNLLRPAGTGVAPVASGPNPATSGPRPTTSGPSSVGRTMTPPIGAAGDVHTASEGESTTEPGQQSGTMVEISSPGHRRNETPLQDMSLKRPADFVATASRRLRSEVVAGDFRPLDRSFDASAFIASNLLDSKAQEVLKDYDPVESFRWVQWALLKSATMVKSIEPRLTMVDELKRRSQKFVGDLKALNQEKLTVEAEKVEAIRAKGKVEEDLRALEVELSNLRKGKDEEVERMKEWEERVGGRDAKGAVAATEIALKAQLGVLLPDFNSSQISFFKDIVDGKVVDLLAP